MKLRALKFGFPLARTSSQPLQLQKGTVNPRTVRKIDATEPDIALLADGGVCFPKATDFRLDLESPQVAIDAGFTTLAGRFPHLERFSLAVHSLDGSHGPRIAKELLHLPSLYALSVRTAESDIMPTEAFGLNEGEQPNFERLIAQVRHLGLHGLTIDERALLALYSSGEGLRSLDLSGTELEDHKLLGDFLVAVTHCDKLRELTLPANETLTDWGVMYWTANLPRLERLNGQPVTKNY